MQTKLKSFVGPNISGGWGWGWVGGSWYIIMPLRGPNLQVRTCKIQVKLDSKLGPSVAKSAGAWDILTDSSQLEVTYT